MVVLVPVPVVTTVPGYRINVHIPADGRPLKTTLPVGIVHVGGVIIPTAGGAGNDGCGFITTFPDWEEMHPFALVTINV